MMSTRLEGPDAEAFSRRRDLILLLAVWAVLVTAIVLLAKQNLSVPGLYYDEAVFAGLAKDFITGHVHGQHMPNNEVAVFLGRPFPVFVQPYLGALKSWMLMPPFTLFGINVAVLRLTNLCLASIGLLLFMLATWRWLGIRAALIAGPVLATDPAYFFLGVLDWGATGPSFICRCASFYLIVRWCRQKRAAQLLFSTFFAGLGFFNKIDFAVLLIGSVIAGTLCYGRLLRRALRGQLPVAAFACLGFLLAASPILFKMPGLLSYGLSGKASSGPAEFADKLDTMISTYDGSYFYRLMDAGGAFEKMFQEATQIRSLAGVIFLIASSAWLLAMAASRRKSRARVARFLLLAAALITIGVFVLPGAVRIHHAVLVFPLPQLVIAVAIASVWKTGSTSKRPTVAVRTLALLAIALLVASQLWVISKTQTLIRETGGRGRWSDSLDAFCRENRHRTDLTIVSLDWGFNEQLAFLTNGPKLYEPVWALGHRIPAGTPLVKNPSSLYLVHPHEYAVAPESAPYSYFAENGDDDAEIQPYFDRQGQVAFYTIRFRPQ
jgi:Dolichyl-phosphate-mannose-protein mannosyltransferase